MPIVFSRFRNCFRRHRRRPCRRPARSPIQRHGPAWIGQSARRLCRSSEIIRFPAAFFGKSSVGRSGRFRAWKKTKTSRLHVFFTFMRPYALRMQPYAVRMHFFAEIEKPIKSRAESTCKKPYALYAPLLGVGPFSAFFLLRELHTVHKSAYDDGTNQALALLPVGIEALPACENQKCIRRCIRISGQKAPIVPLSGNGRRNRRTTHSPRVGADAWSPRF